MQEKTIRNEVIEMFKILLVEDDKNAAKLMQLILTKAGYSVFVVNNGITALNRIDNEYIDLIVLDIMMPEMNGYEFANTIRNNGLDTPILIVTAKQHPEDKYKGFIAGADDYMTKPIDEQEFLFRIKALLRRAKVASEQQIVIGDVVLDYNSLTVSKAGISQTLPKKEFYLLFKLLSNPDKIFTRLQLMDEIWGMNSESVDTTINVHVNRLRKKFGDYPEFKIVAIKGIGYKAVINIEK